MARGAVEPGLERRGKGLQKYYPGARSQSRSPTVAPDARRLVLLSFAMPPLSRTRRPANARRSGSAMGVGSAGIVTGMAVTNNTWRIVGFLFIAAGVAVMVMGGATVTEFIFLATGLLVGFGWGIAAGYWLADR